MPKFELSKPADLLQHLFSHIKREGDCFVWTRSRKPDGYGRQMVSNRQWTTHRLVYFLIHGEIPEGKEVCHTCDNPPCINPMHLFIGSHLDNLKDGAEKGRINRGEDHPKNVLSEEDVTVIYNLLRPKAGKAPYGLRRKLAREYGVSEHTLDCITKRQSWKHLRLGE